MAFLCPLHTKFTLYEEWHYFKACILMPSSVILSFSYDEENEALKIVFVSGTVYVYKDVPEAVYRKMKASKSKGIYFNQHVKSNYAFEKIA